MPRIIIHRKEAKTKYFIEYLGNEVELEMIAIPSGSFMMGAPEDELDSNDDERPQHQVNISGFHMGRYPITQEQWKTIVKLGPSLERELEEDPSHFKENYEGINRWCRPVEQVSWEDAQEFCQRLSRSTGKEYRLPTEAEWEYACRGGTRTPFHFGETINTKLANYDGDSIYGKGVQGEYRKQTTPVGYFKLANNFGLSDMHGNVREWCEDDWHNSYENSPQNGSAWLSGGNNKKITRGASWSHNSGFCRSAYRSRFSCDYRFFTIGFRVVLSL